MTDDLDVRLSAAFRSLDLPGAGPRLVEGLAGLRTMVPADARRGSGPPRIAILAAAASVIAAVAFVAGQLLIAPFGVTPPPGPSPSPTPSPGTTPSPDSTGWPGYTVGTLLQARASGALAGEQVLVFGWWTDMRPNVACGTPSPSPLIVACGDGEFGLTDGEEPIGTWDGDTFVPTDGPALTPLLPIGLPTPGLGRSLIGLRDAEGEPHPPVNVTVVGRFDSSLADACPVELRQACRDRFVIDEVIWAQVSVPVVTPDPSASAPAPDDPPPASWPQIAEACQVPRPRSPEPGDPEPLDLASRGWVPFESLAVQPATLELLAPLAPAWVYVVVTEPDVPLDGWRADPAGSDRMFRWIGQAVCVGWEGMMGMFHSTVPGTTYELWSDGERVPLPIFPPR